MRFKIFYRIALPFWNFYFIKGLRHGSEDFFALQKCKKYICSHRTCFATYILNLENSLSSHTTLQNRNRNNIRCFTGWLTRGLTASFAWRGCCLISFKLYRNLLGWRIALSMKRWAHFLCEASYLCFAKDPAFLTLLPHFEHIYSNDIYAKTHVPPKFQKVYRFDYFQHSCRA